MTFALQWIQCDLRYLDFTVLGKFGVVMADPPWDIHMEVTRLVYQYYYGMSQIFTLCYPQGACFKCLLYFNGRFIMHWFVDPSHIKQRSVFMSKIIRF